MFSLLWTLIIGLLAGALAKLFMPGRDPGGIFVTMALGVAGSFVATYIGIGRAVGLSGYGQGAGFLMSIAGAMLLLFVYRLVRRKPVRI